MTPEEIIEANKLIGEYIYPNLVDIDDTGIWGLNKDKTKEKLLIFNGHYSNILQEEHLKFNSEWNWLMPAVEKFEEVGGKYHTILHHYGSFTTFIVYDDDQDRIFEYYSYHNIEPKKPKIEHYFKCMYEYLKWKKINNL